MENQPLTIICLNCKNGAWLKEIKMENKKVCLTVHCIECLKEETHEINDYLAKFKNVPKIESIKQEQPAITDQDLIDLKEKIQKGREMIIKCEEYKKVIDDLFHLLVDEFVKNVDEFIQANSLVLDFLDQLIDSYEKDKTNAYLGNNLKFLSNFKEIMVPQIIQKEGLTATSKKIEDFNKSILNNFFFKSSYCPNQAPYILKEKKPDNYLNLKELQRIDTKDLKTGYLKIEYKKYWYYYGDMKLIDGRYLLEGYPHKIVLYDPVKKTFDAIYEELKYDFLCKKELSNGDICIVDDRKNFYIFRPKENELTLLITKKLETSGESFNINSTNDTMNTLSDHWAESIIELWKLDTKNDYKDIQMISKISRKRNLKTTLMCGGTRILAFGNKGWFLLDANNLNILWEENIDLGEAKEIFCINEEACYVKLKSTVIVWIENDKVYYKKEFAKDLGFYPNLFLKLEENGENRFLAGGDDGSLADVFYDQFAHEFRIKCKIEVAPPIEIDDDYDSDWPNRYKGESLVPFNVTFCQIIREERQLYVTSDRKRDNKRLFKY